MRLTGKTALITGGGSGIGRACATLFAKEGACISIVDKNREVGLSAERQIRDGGGDASFIKSDISNFASVAELYQKHMKIYGKLDVLLNNAGIFHLGNVLSTSEAEWDSILGTNLKSIFLLCKVFVSNRQARDFEKR